MDTLETLQERLGYTFKDGELLRTALTHPSVSYEGMTSVQHNQRLEFLGDAVLSLIMTDELYKRFPKLGEGPLTKGRAELVNRRSLTELGRQLRIGPLLNLGRGEEKNGGRDRASNLADAFEAVVGALYLDGGYEATRTVVLALFQTSLGFVNDLPQQSNPKGELQEILQSRTAEPPQYREVSFSGPDHAREFECAVWHGGAELGRGKGSTKKEAESQAALAALVALRAKAPEPAPAQPTPESPNGTP